MPAKPVTHPTPEQLAAYAVGKLDEAGIAALDAHLEDCEACRQAVEQVPPDSFLGQVHDARPRRTGTQVAGTTSRPGLTPPPCLIDNPSPAPEPAKLELPSELADHAKFRLVKELGRGGMGVVYLAEHTIMEKLVALKVISPAVLDHPDALARFHAEVKAAAKLDHPNIVRALDADRAGELHLLVMEFVEGMDLARVVEKKGSLPVAHACAYVRQAALGLQHAFEKGMAHRDIKPQNLMLTPQGKVKILDFGLARVRNQTGQQKQLTKFGSFMGTPEYVAPEQATDARNADQQADIYSLGCTLYCLLAGRPPFQEDTPVKTILAHLEKAPQPVHELRPEVPAELSAVVAQMLAKDPSQRYQTPIEVAQTLAPFVRTAGKPGPAGPSASPSRGARPAPGTMLPNDTSRLPAPRGEKASKAPTPPEAARPSPFAGLAAQGAAGPKKQARGSKGGRTPWRLWAAAVVGGVLVLAVAAAVVLLRVRTTEGLLELWIDQAGAEVFLDEKKIDLTWPGEGEPLRIEWPAGQRKLKITKGGFQALTQEVELKAGKAETVRVKLTPNPVAEAAPPKPEAKPNTTAPPPPGPDKPQVVQPPPVVPPAPAKPVLPARWISFLPTEEEVSRNPLASYQNGVLNLRGEEKGGPSSGNHQARNVVARAVVKAEEGQSVSLLLRGKDGQFYSAFFNFRGRRQFGIGKGIWDNREWKYVHLKQGEASRPLNDYFEFVFTAEDDLLVAEADGEEVVRVRDSTLNEAGSVSLAVYHGRALIKSAEMWSLDGGERPARRPPRSQEPPPNPQPAQLPARNGWRELDPARGISWCWDPKAEKGSQKTFRAGVLTLDNGAMDFPQARVRDGAIRAKLKFIRGQNIGLGFRGWYAYHYREPNGTCWFNLGGSIKPNDEFKDIKVVRRAGGYTDFFDYEFEAVGNLLIVRLDGKKIIEVNDPHAPPWPETPVGINAFKARGLFKNIEVKILDK